MKNVLDVGLNVSSVRALNVARTVEFSENTTLIQLTTMDMTRQ